MRLGRRQYTRHQVVWCQIRRERERTYLTDKILTAAFLVLVASAFAQHSYANIVQGTINVDRLKKILEDNVKSKDITTLYYATRGLNALKAKITNAALCEELKNIQVDLSNIEQVFYLSNTAFYSGCQNSLKPDILQAAVRVLDKKDTTIGDIYYAVNTLKALGKATLYDKETGWKNLLQLLKKDNSPQNYAYVFELCEQLSCGAWVTQQGDSVVAQADELDGRMSQWEGGLPVTSAILRSLLGHYKALNKPSPLTATQSYKFAEYLLSRRSVTSARGACLLLEAALALAEDTKVSPIGITIKGQKYITSEVDSIDFEITDLLGRPVKIDEVVAQSATRLADDVVVLSKQPLVQKPNQPTLYTLNLAKIKSEYGLYKIALSAGTRATSLTVGVLGEMSVSELEIGVGDVDGTTAPKTSVVTYPNELKQQIQADHLQKVFLKFTVRDKTKKPILVQQAFIRIGRDGSDQEVLFVAEADGSKTYKVDLNVGVISKHFGHQSGVYTVNLFLGDSAIAEPINWKLANVNFKFSGTPVETECYLKKRSMKPEISHEFRPAEPRPPRLVSDVFAAACAAPLLLLLILWIRVGVNFSNFPFTLSALLFHGGLGSILSLFVVFWLRLTMFETVRYLLALGLVTFISGHRLLRTLAQSKKVSQ